MPTVVYTIKIDDKAILAELYKINAQLVKMESSGTKSFGKISGGSAMSAAKLLVVAEVLKDITVKLVEMGQQALEAFAQIVQGGVEANMSLEATKISLTSIFEGNEGAADAFMDTMQSLAMKLRVPYEELAYIGKGILPDIGSIENTEKVLENFIVLGRDAGQNFTSIRIALEEAMSGNLISLQRRLNIPAKVIDQIRAVADETSMAKALVQVLGDRIEKTGLQVEKFAGSGLMAFGEVQARAKNLQLQFSEPIFEQLKESALELIDVFKENEDDIVMALQSIGDLTADIIEFIANGGMDFLSEVDGEGVKEVVNNLKDMLDLVSLIASQFSGFEIPLSVADAIEGLNIQLLYLAKGIAIVKALNAAAKAEAEVFTSAEAKVDRNPLENLLTTVGKKTNSPGLINLGSKFAASKETRDAADIAWQKAYTEAQADWGKELDSLNSKLEENTRQLNESTAAEVKASEEQKKVGEATLKRAGALNEITEIEQKMAELQEEIQKKLLDAQIDYQRDMEDAQTDLARDLEKATRDAENDRLDAKEKSLKKLRDLEFDYQQDILKEERDYKYELEDIDLEASQKRQDIETEYQRKIQEIQSSFQASAEEAERTQDAIGYLKAMRERDRQLEEAKTSREEDFTDAERSREEDLRKAARNHEDKLSDLKTSLERERNEQQIAYQYELEQIARKEADKRSQLQADYQLELEDLRLKNERRLQDIQRELGAEIKAYQDYAAQLITLSKQIAEYTEIINKGKTSDFFNKLKNWLPGSGSGSIPSTGAPFRANGGPVTGGSTYVVGEKGPELFTPTVDGKIIPNSAIISPNYGYQVGATGSNLQVSNTFNLSENMMSDPIFVAKLRRLVNTEITKVLV
jgi:hypothetical protein